MLWTHSHSKKKVPPWAHRRKRRSDQTGRCFYCDRETQTQTQNCGTLRTRDHFWPRSKGGTQCVIACRRCNEMKGDQLPNEFFDKWHNRWAEMPEWPFVEKGFHERYMAESGRSTLP